MKAVSGHHTGSLRPNLFSCDKMALETRGGKEKTQSRGRESIKMPFKKLVVSPKTDGKIANSGSKMSI